MEEKKIGEVIKEARKSQNKTLKELAEEIGIDTSTLQKYESGTIKNIPYDKLEKISRATGASSMMLGAMSGIVGAVIPAFLGGVALAAGGVALAGATAGLALKPFSTKEEEIENLKKEVAEIEEDYAKLMKKIDDSKSLFQDDSVAQKIKDETFMELQKSFNSLQEEYFKNKYKK